MKRIVICSILLLGAVIISIYAHSKVERVNAEIDARIDALVDIADKIADGENHEEIVSKAEQLTEYWEKEEKILIHFIRHSYIDMISTSMARLPKLAQYGALAEFSAELASVRRQMEHIIGSEQLTLDNLL